jgi:hypothetical protein
MASARPCSALRASLPRNFHETNVDQMSDRVLDDGLRQPCFSTQGIQNTKLAVLVDFHNSCQNGKFGRSQIFALDLSHCVIPHIARARRGRSYLIRLQGQTFNRLPREHPAPQP